MYKKLMILTIFLVSLLTVSAVGAADNATDDVFGVEDNQEILESNQLGKSPGTFTDLANDIYNAKSELNLDRNYIFSDDDADFENGIFINKNIVINGKGHTINGNNQARALIIFGSGVVLNDINFVNCSSSWQGGTIYWMGGDGVVDNCNFVNSKDNDGGAVYWCGEDGIIVNSTFVNCSAENNGGAIYMERDSTIFNCSFMDCSANREGGAVYWDETYCIVSESDFMNCSAEYGGGICFEGAECYLVNSTFKGNDAKNGVDFYTGGQVIAINVTADKISTAIAAPDLNISCGSPKKLMITLRDINNNGFLAYAQISILINGNIYNETTDSKGQIAFSLSDLAEGEYDAAISYSGNDTCYPSITSSHITLSKTDTNISAVYDNGLRELVAILTNEETGKAITNANVRFLVNDVKYTVKTNSNGEARLNLANLPLGTYNATVSYNGNSKYKSSNTTVSVDITKITTSISVYFNSSTNELVVSLINTATGKGISNANIVFNLNGAKTSVKTDKQGQARFTVEDAEALASAGVRYGGNSKYLYSTATCKIEESKIPTVISLVYDKESSCVVATLTNAETGRTISGATVVFNFNKIKNSTKTNKQGQAMFSFADLDPAVYYIGSSYGGNSKYAGSTTATNIVKI